MAKKSAIEKNKRRIRMAKQQSNKRQALRSIARNRELAPEERFEAYLKLAQLPRDGSRMRVRNRCQLTGRPRGYYRKLKMSRIALRDLASIGQIPGMTKASW
ncbi:MULTISPECIES: 30S ribosomal protein S14 [Limibacillus]|jgi:small subunit ribosomal protein S14|uniref:Small ribosomal subunit protein uS14 n=1 Tax=Limibacillus halophilus TaxID=1579333 RepID=A0A839SS97_9PROT|nr:30S ribosomal protein S14 [Limibacillus halophilus]MBB3065671.1 small subunit ribosomal protein S14 [Limibacillus halophilus]